MNKYPDQHLKEGSALYLTLFKSSYLIDQDVNHMLPFIKTLLEIELELTNELKQYCGTVLEYDSNLYNEKITA